MTQPDEFNPPQAANYASLATWAARTQQDWENSLRGQEVNRWGSNGVLGALFQGLQQGKPFVVALLQALLDKGFGEEDGQPDGPFENATEALQSFQTRFRSKWQDIRDARQTANNALNDAAAAATEAADASLLADEVVSSGDNIIKNPSFERTIFDQAGSSFSTKYARTGNRSLRLVANGSTRSYTLLSTDATPRNVSITEDDIFYFEAFVLGDEDNSQTSGGAGGIVMIFEPFDGDNQPLTPIARTLTASTALNGVWTKMSGFVTDLPVGTRSMIMRLELTSAVKSSPSPDTYYFDDVVVRECSLSYNANEAAGQALFNAAETASLANDVISSGSNLIINGGFEDIRYEQAGSFFVTSQSHFGARSLELRGDGLNPKSFVLTSGGATPRTLSVNPGDVLYAEVWIRGRPENTQNSGGTNAIRMFFEPLTGLGGALATSSIAATMSTAINNEWSKISGFVTMPENASKLRVSLEISAAVNDDQEVFFDDVVVREVTLASTANFVATTANTNAQIALSGVTAVDELAAEIVSAGSNILKNPSFESGLFAQGAGTYSNAEARTGTKSLKITGNGSGTKKFTFNSDTSRTSFVPVTPGDVFYAEIWVKGDSGNSQVSGGQDAIQFLFEPFAGATALTPQSINLTAIQTLTSWTQLAGYVTMPPTATRVKISVQLTSGVADNEAYYFDDALVREVSLAATANANAATADANAGIALVNADYATTYAQDIVYSGSNLVINSSFESGLFAQGAGTYSTEQAHTGTRSLKIVSNGSLKSYQLLSDGTTAKTIPAAAGDIFYCEMWVYGHASNSQTSGGEGGIKFLFEPQTRLGANLTDSSVANIASTALNGVWTKVAGYVTMPPNTAKVKISLQLTAAVASNEVYYFDTITVRECTVAKVAQDNVTATVDAVIQSVDGDTAATGNPPTEAKPRLRQAWARLYDAHNNTSGSTDKLPSDVAIAAAAVRATAATGVTNAATAQNKANEAYQYADSAQNLGIQSFTKGQNTIDYINESVTGTYTANNTNASVQTNMKNAWSRIFDGLNGSTGSSTKTPTDIQTAAATVKVASRDYSNLVAGSDFEGITHPWTLGGGWSVATDQFNRGAKSLKRAAGTTSQATAAVTVQAVQDDAFYLEFFVRRDSSFNGSTNSYFRLVDNATSTTISTTSLSAASLTVYDTWVKITKTVNVPAGVQSMTVVMSGDNSAGNMWFDDIVVRRVVTEETLAELNQDKVSNLPADLKTTQSFFTEPRWLPAWVGGLADDVSIPASTVSAAGTPTLSRPTVIPITVTQNRVYTALKFGLSFTSVSVTSFFAGIYSVDQSDSGGQATLVKDLGDIKSQLVSSKIEQTITIPGGGISVQAGEVYYVVLLQVGGTVMNMAYADKSFTPLYMTPTRWPKLLSGYLANQNTLPAGFASTSLTATTVNFWAALGTPSPNTVPSKLQYSDGFTRANTTTLGTGWVTRFGNGLAISSGQAAATASTTSSINTFVSKLNYADQSVSAKFVRQDNVSAGGMMLSLRGDGNGAFVYLRVYQSKAGLLSQVNTTARIYTSAAYSTLGSAFSGGTVRDSQNYSVNDGVIMPQTDLWTFTAVGSTYSGYRNGSLVCSWTDSGGAFAVKSTSREVGVGAVYSGVSLVDDWVAADL